MNNKYTCCFTGHRNIPADKVKQVEISLLNTIKQLIKEGYINFVTGGALGFDTMAAKAVISLKEIYPSITLTVVSPFMGQSDSFLEKDKTAFEEIKAQSDNFIILRMNYEKGCMQERNKKMVDMSSACVAYLTEKQSGTGFTVSYAKRNKLHIINLAQTEEELQTTLF